MKAKLLTSTFINASVLGLLSSYCWWTAAWWRRCDQTCTCLVPWDSRWGFISGNARWSTWRSWMCAAASIQCIRRREHDIALNYAARRTISLNNLKKAKKIRNTWLELDQHPVLKAVVLERSVFFVLLPIFRFLGDTGLRTTSADISRDEQTHVAANTLVCESLGLTSDKPQQSQTRYGRVGTQSLKGEWSQTSLRTSGNSSILSTQEVKRRVY